MDADYHQPNRPIIGGGLTTSVWVALFIGGVIGCYSSTARAGYLTLGVGGGIRMVESTTQVKLTQEIGGQVGSVGRGRLLLGLGLGESFGGGLVGFQAGPKLSFELQLFRGRGVRGYFGPALQIGYGLFAPSGGDARHFVNVDASAALKIYLGRMMLFFQPFGLDMYFADPFVMRYDLVGGLGLVF